MLVGVLTFGCDGKALHVDTSFLQFLDGVFCLLVCVENGYY
jgi:hypothetical protein